MENIISLYFTICIVMWFVDLIAVLAIVFVKPLRMRCWKWYVKLAKEFADICVNVWPELVGETENEDENL